MKVSLVVLSAGATRGKVIPIPRFPFLIGRDSRCHLRPASQVISNRHCALDLRGGKVFLKDLGSTNGTVLNGERLTEERDLRPADQIELGPLTFAVQIETTVPVDQRTPVPPSRPSAPTTEDEDIAAVLLSMADDDAPTPGTINLDKDGVPTGGTEIGIPAPPSSANGENSAAAAGGEKKADKSKAAGTGDTAQVASELLKKYLRRPKAT